MSRNHEEVPRNSKTNMFTEDNSKLEWMYKSGSELLNREEYLLGKAIDKQFEQLDDEEKKKKSLPGVTVPKNHVEHECIPFSIRNYRSLQSDEQVDIQRKILEDPLMAIRQKEMESRRRILENPVKLKELHRLLKKEEEVNKSKSSKKKGKKKKDKKHRKKKKKSKDESESSSSSDEDLDKLLAKKYRQIKEQFGGSDGTIKLKDILRKEVGKSSDDDAKLNSRKRNVSQSADSDSDDARPKMSKHSNRVPDRGRSKLDRGTNRPMYLESKTRRRSSSNSSKDSRDDRRKGKSLGDSQRATKMDQKKSRSAHHAARHSSKDGFSEKRKIFSNETEKNEKLNSSSKQRDSSCSSSESKSGDESTRKRNYGLVTAAGKKIELKRSSSRMDFPKSDRGLAVKSTASNETRRDTYKSKLTDEEKEQRYREMMENAEWREKDRKTKVDKYRKEYERETNQVRDFDKNFINKELHKAMSNQTSVESRLKSNINNIQRSGRAMDSNFAKR